MFGYLELDTLYQAFFKSRSFKVAFDQLHIFKQQKMLQIFKNNLIAAICSFKEKISYNTVKLILFNILCIKLPVKNEEYIIEILKLGSFIQTIDGHHKWSKHSKVGHDIAKHGYYSEGEERSFLTDNSPLWNASEKQTNIMKKAARGLCKRIFYNQHPYKRKYLIITDKCKADKYLSYETLKYLIKKLRSRFITNFYGVKIDLFQIRMQRVK